MKSLVPALVAALLASILTVVCAEMLRSDPSSNPKVAVPGGEATLVGSADSYESLDPQALRDPNTPAVVEELRMRISLLEDQFAMLVDLRQAVVVEETGEITDPLPAGTESREFVLDVLAQKEGDERRQRAEERAQRTEERLLEKVDKIALELGLGGREKEGLLSVLTEEGQRRNSLLELMREGGFGPDNRETMRSEMTTLREWKNEELATQLGPALAEQVSEWEQENDRGWGRGGGMGGGGGGRGR
jgi:hypothetical protein